MEHIAALLLVIGCSGDLRQCDELPAPVPLYESLEDCEADIQPTLAGMIGSSPRLFIKCVAVDPALTEEDLELVWDVTPEGRLEADIEIPGMVVATAPESLQKDYLSQE